jgi:hypothetical protein
MSIRGLIGSWRLRLSLYVFLDAIDRLILGETDIQTATSRQEGIVRPRQGSRRQQHSQSDDLPARVSRQL